MTQTISLLLSAPTAVDVILAIYESIRLLHGK
jgi:hypothetical protein